MMNRSTRASPAGRGGPAGVLYGGRVSMNEKELANERIRKNQLVIELVTKGDFLFPVTSCRLTFRGDHGGARSRDIFLI